jgi:hypothetical protein
LEVAQDIFQDLRIPKQAGGGFRFHPGHHSELMPATRAAFCRLFVCCGRSVTLAFRLAEIDEENGMPAKRELTMRQLRQMLRLVHDGVSAREIGCRLGVARSTIQDNLKRAAATGLNWPLPEDLNDDALEKRLFTHAGVKTGARRRVEPDWAELARDLKRAAVTMMILWEEYRATRPDGYGYSRFCDLLRGFERRLTPVVRQHHVAGGRRNFRTRGLRASSGANTAKRFRPGSTPAPATATGSA